MEVDGKNTPVKFELELEYRDYGIKGASITLLGSTSITINQYSLDESEPDKTVEVQIDLSKLRACKRNPWNCVTPSGLSITLNDDMTVNYEKSEYYAEGLPQGSN